MRAFKFRKFATMLGFAIFFSCVGSSLVQASSITLPEKVQFVVDKTGKYIVPPSQCANIKYLGGGLYLTSFNAGDKLPELHNSRGERVSITVPKQCHFVGIAVDANYAKDFKNYEKHAVIFFSCLASDNTVSEIVCDLSGRILTKAEGLRFIEYMEDDTLFAQGSEPYQFVVMTKAGRVIGKLESSEAEKLGYGLPNPVHDDDYFANGRCTIEKRTSRFTAEAKAALIDLNCKILAKDKFAWIKRFRNGFALAGTINNDKLTQCIIDRQGTIAKEFPSGVSIQFERVGDLLICSDPARASRQCSLLHQDGTSLDKKYYEQIAFWCGKYLAANRGFVDIYDSTGIHLWHGPGKLRDIFEKSPLSDFVANHDGAVIRTTGTTDGDQAKDGLWGSSGNWLIQPNYQRQTFWTQLGIEEPLDQFQFSEPLRPNE